jgi:hypothetical protein
VDVSATVEFQISDFKCRSQISNLRFEIHDYSDLRPARDALTPRAGAHTIGGESRKRKRKMETN